MQTVNRWSTSITRVLAPNPGPMTLDGTNSLIIRHPSSSQVVLVDPGPADAGHLARLTASGEIALILLTHGHLDHSESAPALHAETGAPVRAADPALCLGGAALEDAESIEAAGIRLEVLRTPGHTADSVCFALEDDVLEGAPPGADAAGVMLTGDTILGRGSTVIAPTGSLGDYLATLERLIARGPMAVLPGHGDPISELDAAARAMRDHRAARLDELLAVLDRLGIRPSADAETVSRVSEALYPEVDAAIRYAAEMSTAAQLEYLADAALRRSAPR
ncbi:MBL fold metallo-hydrolase [Microbacterium sp.]|uniref:MBL fold metallo-hydrolase n=1 Tax=Microbacterium sp. TaxID=51671 RepID=UPI0039E70B57